MIKDYQRFGVAIPKDLIPPPLHDVEGFLWESFLELSTERREGGPIPRSALKSYAMEYSGVYGLYDIIRAMDDAYLNYEPGQSKSFSRDMMRG